MKKRRFDKLWLGIGIASLAIFLSITAFLAYSQDQITKNDTSTMITVNYDDVETIAPFNNPGVHKVEGKEWDYEVVVTSSTFMYSPVDLEIPIGSTVKFISTSKDVVHGFEVAGTDISMTVEPGYISEYITKLEQEGEFLIVCNEYCGTGHGQMYSKLKVVNQGEI
nr:cytochrome B5 [Lysinibacillus timonensis]